MRKDCFELKMLGRLADGAGDELGTLFLVPIILLAGLTLTPLVAFGSLGPAIALHQLVGGAVSGFLGILFGVTLFIFSLILVIVFAVLMFKVLLKTPSRWIWYERLNIICAMPMGFVLGYFFADLARSQGQSATMPIAVGFVVGLVMTSLHFLLRKKRLLRLHDLQHEYRNSTLGSAGVC